MIPNALTQELRNGNSATHTEAEVFACPFCSLLLDTTIEFEDVANRIAAINPDEPIEIERCSPWSKQRRNSERKERVSEIVLLNQI